MDQGRSKLSLNFYPVFLISRRQSFCLDVFLQVISLFKLLPTMDLENVSKQKLHFDLCHLWFSESFNNEIMFLCKKNLCSGDVSFVLTKTSSSFCFIVLISIAHSISHTNLCDLFKHWARWKKLKKIAKSLRAWWSDGVTISFRLTGISDGWDRTANSSLFSSSNCHFRK